MKLGRGEFLQGDCLELMCEIPDGSVDMVVTSPPYDNLRTYNDTLNDWTAEKWQAIIAEIFRVTKQGGVVVWVVGDATINGSETGTSFRQALWAMECGFRLHDTMIYAKPNFSAVGALKTRYASVFEYMFVWSKGAPKAFNPLKDRKAKTAGKAKSGTVRQRDGTTKRKSNEGWIQPEYGQRYNIWEISPQTQPGHPAPFPEALARDHILSWSNPGDLVLDPFGGSGTTAIAAENTGRRWTCMERDPTYYELAIARVWDHLLTPAPNAPMLPTKEYIPL